MSMLDNMTVNELLEALEETENYIDNHANHSKSYCACREGKARIKTIRNILRKRGH